MALRLPGKGNFKPVKPVRRPGPRPGASSQAAPSSQAGQSQAQPLAEEPTVALKSSQPSQKPASKEMADREPPASQKPATQQLRTEVPPSQPKPSASQLQQQQPAAQSELPASQPKPPASIPKPQAPASQPKPVLDERSAASPASANKDMDLPRDHEKEGATVSAVPPIVSAIPPVRGTSQRPPKPQFTPTRPSAQKKTKALLLAAATAGPADPSSPRPIHHRRRGGTASVASTRDEEDTRAEDVISAAPPVVAAVITEEEAAESPVVDAPVTVDDSIVNGVTPALDDLPPAVVSTSAAIPPTNGAVDAAALAAAVVATIQPEGTPGPPGPRRKRRTRKPIDLDAQPAPTKRQRTASGRASSGSAEIDEIEDGEEVPEPTGLEGIRTRRAKSTSRRPPSAPRHFTLSHPELDGVEEDGRVGDFEFNPAVAKLSDLATISEGRVSARTIKLHQFQRAEEERKLRERAERAEANWRRLQVVRRKARKLKNIAREQRRLDAQRRGEDPADVVSDDSIDSEEEYEPIPDRLTPPGSPRVAERVAPISFEPVALETMEAEAEEGEEQPPAEEEEDIEGLGFTRQAYEEEEEGGEVLEDFQLPVEADEEGEEGNKFEGLVAHDGYAGGHLDDDGNWIESSENAGMALQRRNEENRRRILDGEDDRQVEVIDNETQFINYSTWGKKVSNERWTPEETELFFDVLRETGENYTLMKAYFPGRNVRQLKKKGHRENKANPQRMTECILGRRKSMDKEYLAKSSGFKVTETYDREVQFLDEVAREKERIISLGPLGEGEGDGAVEARPEDWEMEFPTA